MIHIDGKEIPTCKRGHINVVTKYLKQMYYDYQEAIERNNIKEMVAIEKHILSDEFWGDIVGVGQYMTLDAIRDSYDKSKYEVIRGEHGFPVEIVEK